MVSTRRRGAALEQDILEAVLAELSERGYAALTVEGVAARAGTSKPVLYRRWASKPLLVVAAVGTRADRLEAPDTGTLRGDLVALLTSVPRHFRQYMDRRSLLALLADLDGDAVSHLAALIGTTAATLAHAVEARARSRGELGPDPLPQHLLTLPLDLVRHDAVLRDDLPGDRVTAIVDEVTLPLWRDRTGLSGY